MMTSSKKAWLKGYSLRLGAGFLAYAAGLVAANKLYRKTLEAEWKGALLLLPCLPLLYVAWTVIRSVEGMDELERKVVLEGMAFSGLALGFSCFGFLFVREAFGTEFKAEWVFYLMWVYFGLGAGWSRWRHG
jgi:hypothetical protein